MQRNRESTALHVDYYSTTKKTANPVEPRKPATIRRQATAACIARVAHRSREHDDVHDNGNRSVQESGMKQGFPATPNVIDQPRERTLVATFSPVIRAISLEELRC